jgi:hypothetical protein
MRKCSLGPLIRRESICDQRGRTIEMNNGIVYMNKGCSCSSEVTVKEMFTRHTKSVRTADCAPSVVVKGGF